MASVGDDSTPAGDDEAPYRVLVVDDDEEVAATISLYLEDGHDLETVIETSAADALDRVDDDVHCIISDYRMPDATGIDLLEDVRADYPNMPFLIFTARGSELVASKAISAGATDYLPKGSPEKYDLLANRTVNAIEQAQARAELERAKARFEALSGNTEYAVLTVDESSTVEYANDAVEPLLGYAPSDLEGEPLATIIPDRFVDDHYTVVEQYLESGEEQVDRSGAEFTLVDANGDEVEVEISFDEHVTPSGDRLFTGVLRRSDD